MREATSQIFIKPIEVEHITVENFSLPLDWMAQTINFSHIAVHIPFNVVNLMLGQEFVELVINVLVDFFS